MRTLLLLSVLIIFLGLFLKPMEREAVTAELSDITRNRTIDSVLDYRDNTYYKVIRVDSLYWFNENLAFESSNSQTIELDKDEQTAIVRVYSFEDSRKACPEGWRLPTVDEFDDLVSEIIEADYLGISTLPYNWQTINNNRLKFNFYQTGFLHKKKVMGRKSFNLWLDNSHNEDAYHVHLHDTEPEDGKDHLTIFRHTHEKYKPKKNRKFPIRCVCEVRE